MKKCHKCRKQINAGEAFKERKFVDGTRYYHFDCYYGNGKK